MKAYIKKRQAAETTVPFIIFGDENMPGKSSAREEKNGSPETLTALLVKPGMYPQQITIANDVEAMKKVIDTKYLEFTTPFAGDSVVLIAGELSKIDGSIANRCIKNSGKILDVICGNFLLVGDAENSDDFRSLTPEELTTYENLFHTPQIFAYRDEQLLSIPIPEYLIIKP